MFTNFLQTLGGKLAPIDTSDKNFYEDILNTTLLANSTKKLYLEKLSTIQDQFFHKRVELWWCITHIDEFKKALLEYGKTAKGKTDKSCTRGTLSNFCIPFIYIINSHREIQEKYHHLLKDWKDLRAEIQAPDQDHVMNNEPSHKQQKALFSMDELAKMRDELPVGSDDRLLMSLYTMIPPVRANFGRVKVYHEIPDDNHLEDNFIVLGKHNKLVLGKYKTARYHDALVSELPDKLVKEINHSLEKKPREYLFIQSNGEPYDKGNSFDAFANRRLKKITGKNEFSLTMFRHIYISDPKLDLNNKTLKEKQAVADRMGHSISSQSKYLWMDQEK